MNAGQQRRVDADGSSGTRGTGRGTLIMLALLAIGSAAQSQGLYEPLKVTLSVKTWTNTWDSWVTSPKGTGVALGTQRYQIVQAVNGGTSTSVIPVLSLRHGKFRETVSVMTKTNYTLQDAGTPGGFLVRASRREIDFNSGYAATPNLTLTAGYKRLTQTYGPDTFEWHGPLLGINANAEIGSSWYLYGTAGIGYMKAKLPQSQKDAEGHTRFNAGYRLGEFGLAFSPDFGSEVPGNLLLTIGYRMQTVTTRDYSLGSTDPQGNPPSPNVTTKLVDTTQGPVLSLLLTF
ncbi:MAG: hypothetical protein AB3X44_11980 [Leptothrix sp. (in: b-proteobacteria)]